MATSVVPAFIDALVAAATTALSGTAIVLDGVGITNDPSNFLMIGVDDPDSDIPQSAESREQVANMGTNRSRNEFGTLWCTAVANSGDANQKTARDAVYAIAAVVAGLVRNRATPPFGIAALITVDYSTDSQRLAQGQLTTGAFAQLTFGITYQARL